jgi:hypothetical protein
MRKNDLGQIVSLAANIGVIMGILLLVFELTQNRVIAEAQLRSDYASQLINQLQVIYTNPELAEIMMQHGCGESTNLCESVDQLTYDLYWDGRFRSWENLHYQYRNGLYDEEEFQAARSGWEMLLTIPRVATNWVAARSSYSPEFVEAMNALLPE